MINKTIEVVKIKGDSAYFKQIDRRFQAMFQFYIDGASFIDDDTNWHYFICYMDNKVLGFTSVLEDKRPGWGQMTGIQIHNQNSHCVLLSQFIILPPYQGLGLGSTLLKMVYDYYIKHDKNCVEFSVEEPSDEFQSLMD